MRGRMRRRSPSVNALDPPTGCIKDTGGRTCRPAHSPGLTNMESVLILGATSAIAADVARLYQRRGARLFLVGRNHDKLRALRTELSPNTVVGHATADLTRCDESQALVARAIQALGGLDTAIIAHGLIGDQLQSERDFAEADRILAVNLTSVISLLIPLANHFEQQGSGHIAVLSSVAGERGRPRNYTYGAAKGGLTIYLQGVRSRLWPAVGVHTLKLGPVHTPMTADHPKNRLFAHSPEVARDILAAIDGGVGEAYVPWFWKPIMGTVERLPEPIFQRLGFLSGR